MGVKLSIDNMEFAVASDTLMRFLSSLSGVSFKQFFETTSDQTCAQNTSRNAESQNTELWRGKEQEMPLPQNVQAEQAVLGTMLLDKKLDVLFDVMEMLMPKDFCMKSHQVIYSAIVELVTRNEPVDIVTVKDFLRNTGRLTTGGGVAYVNELAGQAQDSDNIRHYATLIKQKAVLRMLIVSAQQILQNCMENPGETDSIVGFAEKSIMKVVDHKMAVDRGLIRSVRELVMHNIETIEERQGKWLRGVASGFKQLDLLTSGFGPGELTLIAARPGVGKTGLALNIAKNVACDSKQAVAYFTIGSSGDNLSLRLLASLSEVDWMGLRDGQLDRNDWIKLTDSAVMLEQASIYFVSHSLSRIQILAITRKLIKDKMLGLVIVDDLERVRLDYSENGKNRDRSSAVTNILRSFKRLASQFNLPMIVCVELPEDRRKDSTQPPIINDLGLSGIDVQDVDTVLFLHQNNVSGSQETPNKSIMQVIIAQQKSGPTGSRFSLQYDTSCGRFYEEPDEAQAVFS